MATALFGSSAIEWSLTAATGDDRAAVAAWIGEYRRLRPLLQGGRVVRAAPGPRCRGARGDRGRPVARRVLGRGARGGCAPPVRLPGLAAVAMYRVAVLPLSGAPAVIQDPPLPWTTAGSVELPGVALAEIGLPMPRLPLLLPQLLEVTAI